MCILHAINTARTNHPFQRVDVPQFPRELAHLSEYFEVCRGNMSMCLNTEIDFYSPMLCSKNCGSKAGSFSGSFETECFTICQQMTMVASQGTYDGTSREDMVRGDYDRNISLAFLGRIYPTQCKALFVSPNH